MHIRLADVETYINAVALRTFLAAFAISIMGSPFATQEDPETLWYEQSNYVSTHLASMGYGMLWRSSSVNHPDHSRHPHDDLCDSDLLHSFGTQAVNVADVDLLALIQHATVHTGHNQPGLQHPLQRERVDQRARVSWWAVQLHD
jgi:hypothetical protein